MEINTLQTTLPKWEKHISWGLLTYQGFQKKSVFNIFIIFLEDNCPVQWSMAYEDAKQ